MAWQIIRDAADWDRYKLSVIARYMLPPDTPWYDMPPEYPVLAVSMLAYRSSGAATPKIMTCLVLPGDAAQLMAAAGPPAPEPQPQLRRDQTEYMRYVNANLLTIVHELRSVGITTPARYEKQFSVFLAAIDRESVTDPGTISADALCSHEVPPRV